MKSHLFLLILSLMPLIGVSSEEWSIADLADQLGCTQFSGLLPGVGFEYMLGDDKAGPFTVYVPTNEAFDDLPPDVIQKLNADENWRLLHDLVAFHITRGNLSFQKWTNEQRVSTALEDSQLRLNLYKNNSGEVSEMTVSGSTLIKADQKATNGLIQVINRVMYKYPISSMPTYIQETYNLSSLAMLVQVSGFHKNISGQNLTLFAPTNSAFPENSTLFKDLLSSNQSVIFDFLGNHLVHTTQYQVGLKWRIGNSITTVTGKQLQVQQNQQGNLTINGVVLKKTDISVDNGVIHYIDSVLP